MEAEKVGQNGEDIRDRVIDFLREKISALEYKKKVPYREFLPEPEGMTLRKFWEMSSADIVSFRHGKATCVVHFSDYIAEKETLLRSLHERKLCELNGLNFLNVSLVDVLENLEKMVTLRLFRKYFYNEKVERVAA